VPPECPRFLRRSTGVLNLALLNDATSERLTNSSDEGFQTMTGAPELMTVAELVVHYLARQDVSRIFGLVGGHIQPLWDAAARAGIQVIDVRHEGSAVHMAHAEAELSGCIGVAMVTAGPGLTNAVTAIANASISRASVLVISGRPPRPQAGLGAMQELPQAEIVRPLVRRGEAFVSNRRLLERLDAVLLAAMGSDGPSGPCYIDFPTDLLSERVHQADLQPLQWKRRVAHAVVPDPETIASARSLVAKSRRPLIIAGRSAHFAAEAIVRHLDVTGALYLDTGESRGAIPYSHPSYVPAMRSRAMQEADLIVTLGRRLDYQLAYGSPAVFSPSACFLRIGRSFDETSENRRGDVEMRADTLAAITAITDAGAVPTNPDLSWLNAMKSENKQRHEQLTKTMAQQTPGSDGRMHPYQLISAINSHLDNNSVLVVDGGDILSFARAGARAVRSLDCGSLGCLGVGVPFAIGAAITHPERKVFALIGDGSFGFSAMEVSTAARFKARVLFIVANNAAWNIDRQDQLERYGGHLVGVELPDHRYDLVAQGLGLYSELVTQAEELDDAIHRGLQNAPALLNVLITREAVSPDFKNGLAAVPSYQALAKWDRLERQRYE
jgi:acetolactate synthase I/II/III large subunit